MKTEIGRITQFDQNLFSEMLNISGDNGVLPNSDFINDSNNILVTALIDGALAGYAYGYVIDGLKENSKKMFLYSIDVSKRHRRRGVALAIINKLKEIAKEQDCTELFAATEKSNHGACELYKKTGASAENTDDIVFVYKL